MKKGLAIYCLLFSFLAQGQIITTICGNGAHSNTGDGFPALSATIDYPTCSVFDKFGNYYVTTGANGNSVRKISPSGIISTVAGTGTAGFSGDSGLAINALFNLPGAIAVDTFGNIYIADEWNNRIRKVDIATGIVYTIAGNGTGSYGGDGGPATAAMIWEPQGICLDKKGNIYISDNFNDRVRKINDAGIISTYVGTGVAGYSGDGGLADTAKLKGPTGICIDSDDNLYIADNANLRLRKVDTSGFITTIAGNGTCCFSGDGGLAINAGMRPEWVTVDKFGNIYIDGIDYDNRVRMINTSGIINTVVGNGIAGFSGDIGAADSAELNEPEGLTTDSCGNLYIADLSNYRIRKVTYPFCNYLTVNNIAPQNISIYPNPATSELNVNGVTAEKNYALFNVTGIIEQSGTLKQGNNSIAIQSLPPGIHLLELSDNESGKTVKKIIKE